MTPRRLFHPRALHGAAAALCLLLPAGSATGPAAEVRPLSLYQKMGRSPIALWGEVTDGEGRFASVKTLELFRCGVPERPGPACRIAYRLDSFLRPEWEDKIEFKTGERVLLFLRPFTRQDGERPAPDLYALMWGVQGKVLLPPEGEQAWVEAARWAMQAVTTEDLERQAELLREGTSSRNPHIAEAALTELLAQGLSDLAIIPRLTALLDAPREPARLLAMRAIASALKDARAAGREVPARQDLTDRLRGRAAADPSAEMRVEAVRALEALGGEEARLFLDRLGREDPSQMVRYEARRALLDWKP